MSKCSRDAALPDPLTTPGVEPGEDPDDDGAAVVDGVSLVEILVGAGVRLGDPPEAE